MTETFGVAQAGAAFVDCELGGTTIVFGQAIPKWFPLGSTADSFHDVTFDKIFKQS